jgi:hypothetical protein
MSITYLALFMLSEDKNPPQLTAVEADKFYLSEQVCQG